MEETEEMMLSPCLPLSLPRLFRCEREREQMVDEMMEETEQMMLSPCFPLSLPRLIRCEREREQMVLIKEIQQIPRLLPSEREQMVKETKQLIKEIQ